MGVVRDTPMALHIRYDDSTCYAILKDPVVLATLRNALRDAAQDPAFVWVRSIVVDARGIDFDTCEAAELYEMACYVAGIDVNAERRIAIVTRDHPEAIRQAEFLGYCAMKRGAHVHTFQDHDVATAWARDVCTVVEW